MSSRTGSRKGGFGASAVTALTLGFLDFVEVLFLLAFFVAFPIAGFTFGLLGLLVVASFVPLDFVALFLDFGILSVLGAFCLGLFDSVKSVDSLVYFLGCDVVFDSGKVTNFFVDFFWPTDLPCIFFGNNVAGFDLVCNFVALPGFGLAAGFLCQLPTLHLAIFNHDLAISTLHYLTPLFYHFRWHHSICQLDVMQVWQRLNRKQMMSRFMLAKA
jgi:hypothetical protein